MNFTEKLMSVNFEWARIKSHTINKFWWVFIDQFIAIILKIPYIEYILLKTKINLQAHPKMIFQIYLADCSHQTSSNIWHSDIIKIFQKYPERTLFRHHVSESSALLHCIMSLVFSSSSTIISQHRPCSFSSFVIVSWIPFFLTMLHNPYLDMDYHVSESILFSRRHHPPLCLICSLLKY